QSGASKDAREKFFSLFPSSSMTHFREPRVVAMLNVPKMRCVGNIEGGRSPILHQHVELDAVQMQEACDAGLPKVSLRDLIDIDRVKARKAFEKLSRSSVATKKKLM